MTALPAEPITPMAEPPSNIDLEQAVLGALLINNSVIDRISNLEPEHFFEPVHSEIFTAIRSDLHQGTIVTPLSLKTRFEKTHITNDLTAAQYLGTLAVHATSTQNVTAYADEIIKDAKRRQLRELANDLNHMAVIERDNDPKDVIEEVERRAYEIAQGDGQTSGGALIAGAVNNAIAETEAARKRATGLSGLATGIAPIDKRLGGLAPTDFIVIAGRPSMGKTALSVNFAYNIAEAHSPSMGERNTGGPVGFFSLEMSKEQLAQRIISDLSDISVENMRTGRLGDGDFESLQLVANELQDLPIIVDDTPALSIGQVALRARRMKRQYGIRLIIVDYMQLMKSDRRTGGRVEEVAHITTGLKALAKELHVPVIGLSQLSRNVEQREDKRPQLSDLRESGSIEQDADVVIFIYREDYYHERMKPDENDTSAYVDWQQKMSEIRGLSEAIFAKHRHGPIGVEKMRFKGRTTSFRGAA